MPRYQVNRDSFDSEIEHDIVGFSGAVHNTTHRTQPVRYNSASLESGCQEIFILMTRIVLLRNCSVWATTRVSAALLHSLPDSAVLLRLTGILRNDIVQFDCALMGAISKFVEAFISNQNEYSRIKMEVDELCKQKLSEQEINFLWDSRVKKAESLSKKLLERQPDYETEVKNVNDIKNLMTGRVIITRWKDFELVEKMITKNFNLKQTYQHSKSRQNLVTLQQRFRGYDEEHFYVTRRLADDEPYRSLIVEIQVMSGFMWAFSTVEHDIIYKKLHDEPHDDLLSLLEIYKGTASVAEIVMEMIDNFQLDFRQDNAESILREEIRTFILKKKQDIAERSRYLKRNEEIVS